MHKTQNIRQIICTNYAKMMQNKWLQTVCICFAYLLHVFANLFIKMNRLFTHSCRFWQPPQCTFATNVPKNVQTSICTWNGPSVAQRLSGNYPKIEFFYTSIYLHNAVWCGADMALTIYSSNSKHESRQTPSLAMGSPSQKPLAPGLPVDQWEWRRGFEANMHHCFGFLWHNGERWPTLEKVTLVGATSGQTHE